MLRSRTGPQTLSAAGMASLLVAITERDTLEVCVLQDEEKKPKTLDSPVCHSLRKLRLVDEARGTNDEVPRSELAPGRSSAVGRAENSTYFSTENGGGALLEIDHKRCPRWNGFPNVQLISMQYSTMSTLYRLQEHVVN